MDTKSASYKAKTVFEQCRLSKDLEAAENYLRRLPSALLCTVVAARLEYKAVS
jgi:hypothetical protein